jgi:hypothetical protein
MTNEEYVAVCKAYDDLIGCFKSAENWMAVAVVQLHKELIGLKRENEISKEVEYYESTKQLEIH